METKNKADLKDSNSSEEITLFDLIIDIWKCKWIIALFCISSLIAVSIGLNIKYPSIYETECSLLINTPKIDKMKNFYGSEFNKDEIIAPEVLSIALKKLNKEGLDLKDLRPYLRVQTVTPIEKKDLEAEEKGYIFPANHFKVIFSSKNTSIFTKGVREKILYAVINAYKHWQKNTFSDIPEIMPVSDKYEYSDILDIYKNTIDNLMEYIKNDSVLIKRNIYFSNISLRLNTIKSELIFIKEKEIEDLKSKIIDQGIAKDKQSFQNNVKYRIYKLGNEYEYKKLKANAAIELISVLSSVKQEPIEAKNERIDKSISSSNSEVLNKNDLSKNSNRANVISEAISNLIDSAWNYKNEAINLNEKKKEYEAQLRNIKENKIPDEGVVQKLNASLIEIHERIKELTEQLKQWRIKYFDKIIDNQIQVVNEPITLHKREINIYKILAITLIGAAITISFLCLLALYIKRHNSKL